MAVLTPPEKLEAVPARHRGRCALCTDIIWAHEDLIVKLDGAWVHDDCAQSAGHEVTSGG